MRAVIRKQTGGYYQSKVFGYWEDTSEKTGHGFGRYYKTYAYYLVFDDTKTRLLFQPLFQQGPSSLERLVLVTDTDTADWIWGRLGFFGEPYIPSHEIAFHRPKQAFSEAVLKHCQAADAQEEEGLTKAIVSPKDMADFLAVTNSLHDAELKAFSLTESGLRTDFSSPWGYSLRIQFEGDVTCNYYPDDNFGRSWITASLFKESGHYYLVNGPVASAEYLNQGDTWFRSQHLSYQVFPDQRPIEGLSQVHPQLEFPEDRPLRLVEVSLNMTGKTYSYYCDDERIVEGSLILVPVGKANRQRLVRVSRVYYAQADDLDFPLRSLKKVTELYVLKYGDAGDER